MTESSFSKMKWSIKRKVFLSLFVILTIVAFLLYNNFNRLLSIALVNSFNTHVISDVYELKFEKLRVNFFEGSIRVFDVTLQPRETPLRSYPYINSSLRLTTERITLKNVSLIDIVRTGKLNLERVSIVKPDIDLFLSGEKHRFVPLKDSSKKEITTEVGRKKSIEAFNLHEFQLVDAVIHTRNEGQQREFKIERFTISLYDLFISQTNGMDSLAMRQAEFTIGKFMGTLHHGPLRQVSFEDYSIKIDSLNIQHRIDTVQYSFSDFSSDLRALNIQTADSIFHIFMDSFSLSYRDKSLQLRGLTFKPNVGHHRLQKKHLYQHTEFSGSIGTLGLVQVNFDSLIYAKKLFIEEVFLDSVKASIFKDKTKPLDTTKFPLYLGQTIHNIKVPLVIKHVKATNVHLTNTERKPDSTYAKVNLTKASMEIKNITNQSTNQDLIITAEAFVENKAHFNATLSFSYTKPQFKFDAKVLKFNLPDLNPLIEAYTPAKINKGISNEISFSGFAEATKANGTFQFLYSNLEIDLTLKDQAKWKSAVIAFAANSVLHSSNPGHTDLPPRVVKFNIKRDMNKGFANVIIKSLLNGMKETMIMSKENRKTYKKAKKEVNQQDKK